MELKLKNHLLIPLVNWLSNQMLHGSQSRQRTRFIKLLEERVAEIDKERHILYEKYSVKKDGKTIYLDGDKETTEKTLTTKYNLKDTEAFNKELLDYMSEELILDITPATKDTIYTVRDIILDTTQEFSGQEAVSYNQWAEAFETVNKQVKLKDVI